MDFRKLNNICMKMRPHMPNMEELLYQTLTEVTRLQNESLWISKIDLKYAYGQLKLSKETRRQCNLPKTGGNVNE